MCLSLLVGIVWLAVWLAVLILAVDGSRALAIPMLGGQAQHARGGLFAQSDVFLSWRRE